jgi:hypothetical protein
MDLHLSKGNDVFWVDCNGELSFCQTNPYHKSKICQLCIKRKNKGLKLLEGSVMRISLAPLLNTKIKIPVVGDLEELKKQNMNRLDAGFAAASSFVTVNKDPNPDLQKHFKIWSEAYKAAASIFSFADDILKTGDFGSVFVFNGRFAPERGILRAAQKNKIDYNIHDRGRDIQHYMVWRNSTPQDRKKFIERLNREWEKSTAPENKKIKIGSAFFEERVRGKEQTWSSFVSEQVPDRLPKNWKQNQVNITIYLSSDDELVAVSNEWKNPVYRSQLEGVKQILEDASQEINFFVRVHPHLLGVKNSWTKELLSLTYKNLTIIPANSKVSTYALMKASDKIISFGSATGIEAAYWGIPSILASVSYYHGIGSTYDASSHDEVLNFIHADLRPKDILPAIKYGFYYKVYGTPYSHYRASSLYSGKYKGKLLSGNFLKDHFIFLLSKYKLINPLIKKIKKIVHFFKFNLNLT